MAILGEVFSIIRNGASIKQIDGANGFPITRIETISNRVIDRNRLGYANVFDITEYESYVLQSGDILMSHINSEKHLGKTALYIKKGNEKIIHGMNLLMLRANSEVILPLYAKYFFDSNLFLKQIPNITKKSVNQASFTVTALKKLEIKIPQMVEQKRIIDIMSRLDNIIQYRKDQLEKLDLFVKSRFIEMFGLLLTQEKAVTLENLISQNIITYHLDGNHGGLYPKADEFVRTGVPYLGANAIIDGRIDFKKAKFLTERKASILRKGIAQNGDVLFAHNATVGPVAILKTDYKKVIVSTSLTVYRCNNRRILPVFIKYFMESEFFVNQYKKDMKQTTRNQVPITHQKKFMFIVPPIELQNQFADFVAQVDKSKFVVTAKFQ